MRNVQFGLKTVLNSIEAQYCQLKISSKVEVGTEIIFSMQTRKKEINLTMDSLKLQMDELTTQNVSVAELDKLVNISESDYNEEI